MPPHFASRLRTLTPAAPADTAFCYISLQEGEEETFYDAMKRDMADRSAKTKAALDALDPATRVAMEGHRPGAYVRLRFTGVPCELVTNFDPRFPILVSGRGAGEGRLGRCLGWLGGWVAGWPTDRIKIFGPV